MAAPFRQLAVRLYAVTGAIAFALSLACGVWLYTSLGRVADLTPAPGSISGAATAAAGGWTRALAIDLLLFGLFALHHSLLARSGAKIVLARWLPPALERTTYVWIASLLFLLVCIAWQPIPGVAYDVRGWAAWLLVLVQLTGVLLTLGAAAAIDPRELSGLRQAWHHGSANDGGANDGTASTDDAVAATPDERPVTFTIRGAYGLVRHPIYLGWFLMVWGAPHMTWGRVAFAAVSSFYLLIAIPWEERSLDAQHGEAYRRYRAQVRWRVLPGLY